MSKPLNNIVGDWGGFEKLVASLHETGTVEVQHNVTLTGKSGASRQIDVVVRHREGLYEHLIIVECKYWKENVSRLHVDALIAAVDDLSASRGVMFSVQGFQEGAIAAARYAAIDLFKIRELHEAEWGSPGRMIDLHLQFFECSIGNFALHGARSLVQQGTVAAPISLHLRLGADGQSSTTRYLTDGGGFAKQSLEERILEAARKSLRHFTQESFTINGGGECTTYMLGGVNLEPIKPFLIPRDNMMLIVPKLSFDLGIKISQSRIQKDRAENYHFALAVENCINGEVSSVSRHVESSLTTLSLLTGISPNSAEMSFQNGSVLRVYLKSLFAFEEMQGLISVPFEACRSKAALASESDLPEQG